MSSNPKDLKDKEARTIFGHIGSGAHKFLIVAISLLFSLSAEAAPQIRIDSGPFVRDSSSTAVFEFSSPVEAEFQCRLDAEPWAVCQDTIQYSDLPVGQHRFLIRAREPGTAYEPQYQLYNWRVVETPPTARITSGPSHPSRLNSGEFLFEAESDSDFQCRIDNSSWFDCSSPYNFSDLADGRHRFTVRVRNTDGIWAPGYAYRYWNIDTALSSETPDISYANTIIATAPAAVTNQAQASFSFSASEETQFRCRIDSMPWADCTSPVTYDGLSPGRHVFRVQSRPDSGTWDHGYTSYSWKIQDASSQPVPRIIITQGPAHPTESDVATFQFEADEAATFRCRLDSSSWADCASPVTYNDLSPGRHSLRIRARGSDGSWGPGTAIYRWDINAVIAEPTCPVDADPWSDPATWGGAVPVAGDEVVIADEQYIALDTDTPPLSSLTVNGVLEFCRQDLALTSDWVMVHGELHIGSEAEPFEQRAILTLTGDDPDQSIMGMGTRGIMVMGGVLEIHGQPPETRWARINQHAEAGSNLLQMEVSPDWQVGDQIVIAPTDYYGSGHSEDFTIAAIEGEQVTLSANLETARWGRLQYVTSSGMALTPDGSVSPPDETVPMVLDERAVVGNLSRNIVIQAPDDALWQNEGFGAHLMIMDLSSEIHVEGVEFHRVGQAGRLGRYPWHWHILSYAEDGSELGDVVDHYFRNNSIHHSANRCITIHATNGTVVEGNVCYDISGHGIFFEDATERRNRVENNLVLRTRGVPAELALKLHEIRAGGGTSAQGGGGRGSSGIWVSNPDNIVRGNHTADADGFGLWMAFPFQPVGATSNVPIIPIRLQFGVFDNNIVHSNRLEGVNFDHAEIDDLGDVRGGRYVSTTDGALDYNGSTILGFEMTGLQIWKNGLGGIWSRTIQPMFSQFVVADNEDIYFDGAGIDGDINRSLVVGTSLNMPTPRPEPGVNDPTAFATYHSQFDIHDNVVIDFPLDDGAISGLFNTDDYYVRPVDKGQFRNSGNLLINTHGGYRVPHPQPYYTLAGAVWDPYGFWGVPENYFVYDEPFLTHAGNCVSVSPGAAESGGISCDGEYYGINNFIFNSIRAQDLMAIRVTRYDETSPDQVVDVWEVAAAVPGANFGHQRDFAARQNGIFLLEFPNESDPAAPTIPTDVAVDVTNMLTDNDRFVLGIAFDGDELAQVFTTSNFNRYLDVDYETEVDNFKQTYTQVDSRQAVIESAGGTYYQDVTNDIVWVHLVGGINQRWDDEDFPPDSDQRLYRELYLKVH